MYDFLLELQCVLGRLFIPLLRDPWGVLVLPKFEVNLQAPQNFEFE